jgi:N-acetylglucosamine-6-phosphate deacetylase
MAQFAITAARALTPLSEVPNAVVLVADGVITAVGSREALSIAPGVPVVDGGDATLVPGFVDVHIHGAGGHDVMEGNPAALRAVARTIARFGTTSFLPTTVTAATDTTCRALHGIAVEIARWDVKREPTVSAQPLGFHLEGPFISPARRGVHPPDHIAAPSIALFEQFLEAAAGQVRILTLAPELPGAIELIAAARHRGIEVGMGHTDATYAQTRAAIAAGAHHAVHLYNAMRPFNHRETGVIGAVLTSPEVGAEVIADGVHVDDPALRVLLASKGVEQTLLVSDGTAATGMPDGDYKLGPFEVKVTAGVCRNTEGKLAGSTLTLDRALRNMTALGVPLSDALRMVTWNPARLLGIEKKKGVLAPGADADMVLLDNHLQVRQVFTRGIGTSA